MTTPNINIQSGLSGPCDERVADTNTPKFQHVIAQEHRKRRRSTSQESDGLSGLDLSNIIIPDHEVTSEGPLYETHDGLLPRSKRLKVLRHANTPPGPDALTALRDRIPPHLLYQLPDLVSMSFEDHAFSKPGIGIHYTRLRLLVGIHSGSETAKKEDKVWAYLKPRLNQNNRVTPTIEMILEEDQGNRGIRNEVQIAWTTDIQPGLVSLAPVFAQVINDAQLKAVVKYGFLLAEDAKLFGYGRYCVPVNTALVTHLTKLCEQHQAARAGAGIDMAQESTRWSETCESGATPNKPDSGTQRCPNKPQTSSHIPSQGERHHSSSSNTVLPDAPRTAHPAPTAYIHPMQPQKRCPTRHSPPRNPLANRRPSKPDSMSLSIMSLKQQRKTIGGRISKTRSTIADYRTTMTQCKDSIAELEDEARGLEVEKMEVEVQLRSARRGGVW